MSPLDPARPSDEGADPTAGPVPAPRPAPSPGTAESAGAPAGPVPGVAPAAVRWARRLGSPVRRPPVRRPAVLLAAALVGALSVAVVSTSTGDAAASASSPSSVAAELGLAGDGGSPSPAVATDRLRALAASRAERQAERASAAAARTAADQAAVAAAAEAARPATVDPAPAARLTSTFAMRWGVMHWGIDLAGPVGTPEYAAADGVVLKAGPAGGFGQAVYIQHAGGDVTVYGHMEELLVTAGQAVRAGDEIALMGAEGEATGPHLHFEVHQGGMEGPRTDPLVWLAARGVHI